MLIVGREGEREREGRKKWCGVGHSETEKKMVKRRCVQDRLANAAAAAAPTTSSLQHISYASYAIPFLSLFVCAPNCPPPTLSFLYCSSFFSLLPFSTTSPLSTSLLFSPFSFFSFVGNIGFGRINVIIIYIWDRI